MHQSEDWQRREFNRLAEEIERAIYEDRRVPYYKDRAKKGDAK